MSSRVLMGLLAVLVLGTGLSTGGQSQVATPGLFELPVPGPLTVYAARRAAASVVGELLTYSEAQTDAVNLADHLLAAARIQSAYDRPRHDPMIEIVTDQQGLTSIRRHHRLRVREMERLNPDVDLDALGLGDEVVVWRYDPDLPGRSRYRPNRGRLDTGELFPQGEGWVLADERRAYAAGQTIDALIHGMRQVMSDHPGGQEMMIADLSFIRGGPMRPHRSHQSGRDVDVTYYRRTSDTPTFTRCRVEDLDQKRTWTFLRTQITQHDVVYVFMQRSLQVQLYEYALSIGEHPGWLASLFQFGPYRHRNGNGIIRTASGHHDHMHIRYGCGPRDIRCRAAH